MLLSIQFPFADSRAFLNDGVKLLDRPTWPSVSPDSDFVRSFGGIRKRRLGGLTGWIGENALCEAGRALRFSKITNFRDAETKLNVPLALSFRRFFFDGLAVGKFEVGITTDRHTTKNLGRKQTFDFIHHCLDLPITIPGLSDKVVTAEFARKPINTVLARAGKPLARLYAGSSISYPPRIALEDWWVLPGSPLLFLVHKSSERIHIPFWGQSVPRSENLECDLSFYTVPYAGKNLRMWVMGLSPYANYRDIRSLKICLLRLHAEHESMRLILQNVATNKIDIRPKTDESNSLQFYLNEATRRVSRLGAEADSLSEGDIAELARESEDMVNPGERDALLETLKNINVRKHVFYKVEEYTNTQIYIKEFFGGSKYEKEVFMGSKYEIKGGTQGAVGDNAQASNNVFNTWNQSGGNLEDLAKELSLLLAELNKNAKDPKEVESAGAVAKAKVAAEEGDGASVFEHLKNAGKWALDTAKAIGIPVAIEALKYAVGIG